MKQNDYCRYLAQLRRTNQVTFSKREDTIDFVVTYVSDLYKDYLQYIATIPNTIRTQRIDSEPSLVKMFVEDYLNENVPGGGLFFWLAKKFNWNFYELRIGTEPKDDTLYNIIVKKISQGDNVTQTFPDSYVIIIRNDNEVRLEMV